jgi:hypothetical protein
MSKGPGGIDVWRPVDLTAQYPPYTSESAALSDRGERQRGAAGAYSFIDEVKQRAADDGVNYEQPAPKSILQDWVLQLGLRHQGVLVSAIRGCDSATKDDPAKALIRAYRAEILVCHCGDVRLASSFIEGVDARTLRARMTAFLSSFDHYPIHFVLHLLHAAQIVGYKKKHGTSTHDKSPEDWADFYQRLCRKMHVNAEAEWQLDKRLDADEQTFARNAA